MIVLACVAGVFVLAALLAAVVMLDRCVDRSYDQGWEDRDDNLWALSLNRPSPTPRKAQQ